MSAATLDLITAVDRLMERAVVAPEAVDDQGVAEWMSDLPAGIDRRQAKAIRRAARLAMKLAARRTVERDWRQGIDAVLGSAGWQPTLDLAQHGLEVHPSDEIFEQAQLRFRLVYLRPWLEGVTFDEYMASR